MDRRRAAAGAGAARVWSQRAQERAGHVSRATVSFWGLMAMLALVGLLSALLVGGGVGCAGWGERGGYGPGSGGMGDRVAERMAPPQVVVVPERVVSDGKGGQVTLPEKRIDVPGGNGAREAQELARRAVGGPVGEVLAIALGVAGMGAAEWQRRRARKEQAIADAAMGAIQGEPDKDRRASLKASAGARAYEKGYGEALAVRGAQVKERIRGGRGRAG